MRALLQKIERRLFPCGDRLKALVDSHNLVCEDTKTALQELTRMHIKIERDIVTPEFTGGKMYINGQFECFTLEDPMREVDGAPVKDWKIAGKTAIPKGKYAVIIDYSNKFKKKLPLLQNVPGFDGVRIHAGNSVKDTEGCPLVGKARDVKSGLVINSKLAMDAFMAKLETAISQGKQVECEIV